MNLCPTCRNALNPACAQPVCRAENDRADAALDLQIESSES